MEFVIKQQESFAGNMEKADERMTRLEAAFVGLVNIVSETVKVQRELLETQKMLVESQKQTGAQLNALLNTIERYISEDRDGSLIN
jgi:hypothetical protein